MLSGVQEIPEGLLEKFKDNLASSLIKALSNREPKATLRMSNIGKPCERQLWYEINQPELAEPLRPETYLKFMYGHILEEVLLFLAELAGHEVSGTQDEQQIEGVKGHRDAVVDGCLVDVKSASTYSFKKFKENRLQEDDSFGYIPQLQSYLEAGQDDPLITEKDRAYFVVIDKTLGHICTTEVKKAPVSLVDSYTRKIKMVGKDVPPERGFTSEAFGASGNKKLGVNCSYCSFKQSCWPNLRTFLYSNGPVFLTQVTREPNVPELKTIEVLDE